MKIIEVNDPSRDVEVFRFRPDALVEALSYKMEQIHIYSNSYGPKKIFSASTRVINEAFKEGVMQVWSIRLFVLTFITHHRYSSIGSGI